MKRIYDYIIAILGTIGIICLYEKIRPETNVNNYNNSIKKAKESTITMDHTIDGYSDKRTNKLKERIKKAETGGKSKKVKRLTKKTTLIFR